MKFLTKIRSNFNFFPPPPWRGKTLFSKEHPPIEWPEDAKAWKVSRSPRLTIYLRQGNHRKRVRLDGGSFFPIAACECGAWRFQETLRIQYRPTHRLKGHVNFGIIRREVNPSRVQKAPTHSRVWIAQRRPSMCRQNTSMELQYLRSDLLGQFLPLFRFLVQLFPLGLLRSLKMNHAV